MRPLLKLVPDNTNIDFMRARWFAVLLSILMVGASIALIATRGLNLGVDFVGGQQIQATFTQAPSLERLRGSIGGLNLGEPTIQQFGRPNEIAVRMPRPPAGVEDAEATRRIQAAMRAVDPQVRFDNVEAVSGNVSEELAWDGALALLLAMLGIVAYIWFRFEWQFSVGALVSLLHDMIIVVGFYALTQIEVGLNFIAALLTLIGYSLNDTVVVYDRIRENLRRYRKMGIEELLNLSVNETLSRTIATNGSVLLAVLALVLIGPETIYPLTIGILVGVVVGTYSSIYVARFLLVPLGVGPDSFLPRAAPTGAERVAPRT
ncbi:protein translocase subunit SecF [Sphingomonas lenta]|uniref:Protein-export membrane protein SecF n=2 Tax=Sphingomonas lenta TaxID=1141887 RepID=A0A2A2SGI3_9SPHN|nr:protein translocase subunit SecF [Sphingomonas lenta]PAX08404.1 protein translocase subunit SecF [Sphingomonas lenta]